MHQQQPDPYVGRQTGAAVRHHHAAHVQSQPAVGVADVAADATSTVGRSDSPPDTVNACDPSRPARSRVTLGADRRHTPRRPLGPVDQRADPQRIGLEARGETGAPESAVSIVWIVWLRSSCASSRTRTRF